MSSDEDRGLPLTLSNVNKCKKYRYFDRNRKWAELYDHGSSSDSVNSSDKLDEMLLQKPFQFTTTRRFWVYKYNLGRSKHGEYVRTCLPLQMYPDKFKEYFRMEISTYDYILASIRHRIEKSSCRPSITPAERLSVTLRYLSTGMSYRALALVF